MWFSNNKSTLNFRILCKTFRFNWTVIFNKYHPNDNEKENETFDKRNT